MNINFRIKIEQLEAENAELKQELNERRTQIDLLVQSKMSAGGEIVKLKEELAELKSKLQSPIKANEFIELKNRIDKTDSLILEIVDSLNKRIVSLEGAPCD